MRPLPPLATATPDEAWNALLRLRREEPRLASYASIRVEAGGTKESFRATIATDERGRLRVDAFTPMGTAAFTLYADGGAATMIDHAQRTWWKGPFPTAARSLGLPESMTARELAMIAFGLPASTSAESERGERFVQEGIAYTVAAGGLASARADAWSASFEPAAQPPSSVTITAADGSRSITVRHIEAGAASRAVPVPDVDPSYRCCVAPAVR